MKQKREMLILIYLSIFTAAFGFIMYSPLITSFSNTYRISISQAGMVGSVLCVGELVMIFFNDFLAGRFSNLSLVAAGVAVHAISMFLIGLAPSFLILIIAFFINGAAMSLLNVVSNAWISDTFGEQRNSYLNIFHGIYGLGSMMAPILPTVILACGMNWRFNYIAIGMFSIVLFAVTGIKVKKQEKTAKEKDKDIQQEGSFPFYRLFLCPEILLICIACLFYMGFDMMISTYIASYAELMLQAAEIAGLTVTFYWIGCAAGRLLYPVLFSRYQTQRYLICASLIAGVLLFCCVLTQNKWLLMILIMTVGFLSGVNFPLEIGMACEKYPEHSVAATNAVAVSGSLGGIIFPMAAGQLMEKTGYRSLLFLGIFLMSGIVINLSGLIFVERRKQHV